MTYPLFLLTPSIIKIQCYCSRASLAPYLVEECPPVECCLKAELNVVRTVVAECMAASMHQLRQDTTTMPASSCYVCYVLLDLEEELLPLLSDPVPTPQQEGEPEVDNEEKNNFSSNVRGTH